MDKATQRGKILAHCKEHGSITVREAFEELHINSPTKRISELRQAGYIVNTEVITKAKDDGSTVRFNRYYIFPKYGDNVVSVSIGDKVKFILTTIKCGIFTDEEKDAALIEGTVTYINNHGRYFTAEYEINGVKYKESFKFADLGLAVTKCG